MKKRIDNEFTEMLKSVNNTYDDFVESALYWCNALNCKTEIAHFIKNNPNTSSGYVLLEIQKIKFGM